MMQMSCVSGAGQRSASKDEPITPVVSVSSKLSTPEVAVMPMTGGVLIAWKPIDEADGYFVYRESKDSKKLLGIGPRESQGFIDRDPLEAPAKYSVQAFKLSDPSEKQETQALPGTMRQSESHNGEGQVVSDVSDLERIASVGSFDACVAFLEKRRRRRRSYNISVWMRRRSL